MSLLCYSRIRFVSRATSLLLASARPSAHVVSVFAGGAEGSLAAGQSPLGTPPPSKYGVNSVRKYTTYMKTFAFEALAKQHAGKLSLSHIFPGLVFGPNFTSDDMPAWFKAIWRVFSPLIRAFWAVPEEECGRRMLYLATERYPARCSAAIGAVLSTDGVEGGGAYSVNWDDEVTTPKIKKLYKRMREEGFGETVWRHTIETFEHIETKQVKRGD
jgi:hypothetical protein